MSDTCLMLLKATVTQAAGAVPGFAAGLVVLAVVVALIVVCDTALGSLLRMAHPAGAGGRVSGPRLYAHGDHARRLRRPAGPVASPSASWSAA